VKPLYSYLLIFLLILGCAKEDQSRSVKVKTTIPTAEDSLPTANDSDDLDEVATAVETPDEDAPTSTEETYISNFEGSWILFHAKTDPVLVRFDPEKINRCDLTKIISLTNVQVSGRHYKIDKQGQMEQADSAYLVDDKELNLENIYNNIICEITLDHPSFDYDMISGAMPSSNPNINIKYGFSYLKIKESTLLLRGLWCYDLLNESKLFFCQNEIYVDEKFTTSVFYLKNLNKK